MKQYYVYQDSMSAGGTIYGGGWTREEAAAEASAGLGTTRGTLYAVSEDLGNRVDAEDDTLELRAAVWAESEGLREQLAKRHPSGR